MELRFLGFISSPVSSRCFFLQTETNTQQNKNKIDLAPNQFITSRYYFEPDEQICCWSDLDSICCVTIVGHFFPHATRKLLHSQMFLSPWLSTSVQMPRFPVFVVLKVHCGTFQVPFHSGLMLRGEMFLYRWKCLHGYACVPLRRLCINDGRSCSHRGQCRLMKLSDARCYSPVIKLELCWIWWLYLTISRNYHFLNVTLMEKILQELGRCFVVPDFSFCNIRVHTARASLSYKYKVTELFQRYYKICVKFGLQPATKHPCFTHKGRKVKHLWIYIKIYMKRPRIWVLCVRLGLSTFHV